MSIRGRPRIDKALPDQDVCRYCNGRHVRNLAELVRATRGEEPVDVCDCDMCRVCAWLRDWTN